MKYLLSFSSSLPSIVTLTKNPYRSSSLLQTLVSAMAGSGEDLSSFSNNNNVDSSTADPSTGTQIQIPTAVASSNDVDLEFGFKRPEMYKDKFPGPVNPYDRHVFLCFKTAESWPGRVEDGEFDPLPKKLADALQSRKKDIQGKTRFAVIEGNDENEFKDGDVLIFPEMIRYKSLNHEEVDNFVEDVLVKGTTWALGAPETLKGYHVFVCCHNSRDRRCGVCGPELVQKLNKEIELQGLKDQVFVSPCSHVGGHKYAGNLIIFGPNSEGTVMGHWYGYVTPDDVPILLDQHIGKGQVVERLWRGEVCNFQEENKEIDEQKPQKNGGVNYFTETNLDKSEKELLGVGTNGNVENTGGCCQGSSGFSCCSLDRSVADNNPKECSSTGAKGFGGMSAWFSKWEQGDIFAAAAVIGAVASVAVAYNIYRRSG